METIVNYTEGKYSGSLLCNDYSIHGEGNTFEKMIIDLIKGVESYNSYLKKKQKKIINISDLTLSFKLGQIPYVYN